MNEDAFADLPDDLQQALEAKVFGEPLSRMGGAMWDEIDLSGLELTKSTEDNEIHSASAVDISTFQDISAQIREKVITEVSETGIDAAAAYELIKAEMANQ
jgi:hypothetical protein